MKKRICAVIMCLLLAVNLVGTPKAKAVVSEGALLGSIFGSLLVSLGYSWAADNFDAPSFGEAIYDLIKQCDEEMDTGIQLLIDSNLTGLVATGPGKLQLNYQWVSLARSFAEWFQTKFFSGGNTSDVVAGSDIIRTVIDGNVYLNGFRVFVTRSNSDFSITASEVYNTYGGMLIPFPSYPDFYLKSTSSSYMIFHYLDGTQSVNVQNVYFKLGTVSGTSDYNKVSIYHDSNYLENSANTELVNALTEAYFEALSSLSAEKPAEAHYPDVAEDGSQVYEITVDGVTATDIEGIIQGAVDRILAGTAAIAGEVAQAQDVPVEPEVPAASEYAVPGLETIFPFCIPFDIYAFCSALNAEPVAPSFEWRMQYAPLGLDYTFEIDLSAFDGVAQILRTMELLAFCVGLAFWTRHLIRG